MGIKTSAASCLQAVVLQGIRNITHFDEYLTHQSEAVWLTALHVSPDRSAAHLIPTETNGKTDRKFKRKKLKTGKLTRWELKYWRGTADCI